MNSDGPPLSGNLVFTTTSSATGMILSVSVNTSVPTRSIGRRMRCGRFDTLGWYVLIRMHKTFISMHLRPISDHMVIELIEEGSTTAAGIVLPDTAKDKPERGKVLSVGPGKMDDGALVPMEVKTGDTVLFKKYAPDEFKIDGKKVYIISASDVMAIIE